MQILDMVVERLNSAIYKLGTEWVKGARRDEQRDDGLIILLYSGAELHAIMTEEKDQFEFYFPETQKVIPVPKSNILGRPS